MLGLVTDKPPARARIHFRRGLAVEHVRENTWHWVDPIEGTHRAYVVAEAVEYASTIEEQIARSRKQ